MICSTVSSPISRGRPTRGSSSSPSTPVSTQRRRHLPTVAGLQPSRSAIAVSAAPSAAASTILARSASACDTVCRRVQRSNTCRSSPLISTTGGGRPRRPPGTASSRASPSPATPRSANRARHFDTVASLHPSSAASSRFDAPRAAPSTILARTRCRCEIPASAAIASNASSAAPVTTTGTALRPGRPIWQVCLVMSAACHTTPPKT